MLSKKKGCMVFTIIGFAFFFCCFTGKKLAEQGNIIWSRGYTLALLSGSLLLGILAGCAVCLAMYAYAGRSSSQADMQNPACYRRGLFCHLSVPFCFLLSWGLTALAWLPGYLAYYPAICSYDTPIQTGQIVSNMYNDHHPIAHTLLVEGFMKLGEAVTGSVNTGIALYALVQLLCLSAVFALGIALLRAWNASWPWLLGLLLYAMFFPFHMYMSVTTTKDTVFSVFFLLQMMTLYGILRRRRDTLLPDLWDGGFLLSTIGMVLFRTNGRYALLVLLAALLITALFAKKAKRLFGRLLLISLGGFAAGSVILSLLFTVSGAQQGDRREMLSMPIQQLARCMVYHGGAGVLAEDDNTMEETDKALIRDFLLDEGYREYRPDISDPVKRHTNTYVFVYRMKEFMTTYFRLLGQYPGDYINAALAVNAGYLYPWDKSHAYINVSEGSRGMGYIQTNWVEEELNPRGIYKDSKWEGLHGLLERYAESNSHLKAPVLRLLLAPGAYLWLYLLLAGYLMLHKRYILLIPLSLTLGYYGTLLLGPAVQLRYIYPVMTALPFVFAVCVSAGRKEETGNDR